MKAPSEPPETGELKLDNRSSADECRQMAGRALDGLLPVDATGEVVWERDPSGERSLGLGGVKDTEGEDIPTETGLTTCSLS